MDPSVWSFSSALGSDGRFVVAGASNGYLAMARFLPDGELDPSFGDGGAVKTFQGYLEGLVILPDGSIVGVGGAGSRWLVCRFTAAGELDASFGDGGIAQGAYRGEALGVALDASGRILVVGRSMDHAAIARYRAGGSPDRSFSDDGRRELRFPGGEPWDADVMFEVASTAAGGIVAVGRVYGSAVGVVRLSGSGHRDRSFGVNGLITTQIGYDSTGTAVLVRDGRILVAVQYADSESNAAAVMALQLNGSPDPSYGEGGIAVIDPVESLDAVVVMASHPGGGVVVGDAAATGSGEFEPFLARLDADGEPVTTFGDGGSVTVPVRGRNFPTGVFVRPDGRIVVGGTHEVDSGGRLEAVQVQA
jgi:uncharacterized delta-60 repeat protein